MIFFWEILVTWQAFNGLEPIIIPHNYYHSCQEIGSLLVGSDDRSSGQL